MHLEAQSAIDLGRFGQAIASLQEVIRLVESDPSLGRGQLVDMYGQLGEAQWLEGRSDEALDNLRQSYRVARNTPGTPALAIHTAAWQLASTLAVRASDFGEAIELLRPAYEWARAGKSDVPSVAANLVVTYARFLVSFGRVDDGLTALDEAPALLKGEAPHVNIEGPALLARAGALNHQGRYAQAEALADKARVLFASVADYEDWVLISTRVKRRIQAASGRADAAWADFQHEQSRLASQQIVRGPGALLIQIESAQLQLADGRVPAARSAAEQVLAEVERSPNRRHERLLEAEASLVVGRAALRQGDLGPASAALERAISIYRAIFDPACSLALADALGYVAHVQRALKQAALGAASAEEARRIHTCHRTVGAHHVAVLGADRG
jgi:tetratricopeptide (TPR) repeat protein